MITAYLQLGTNMGDKMENLSTATMHITKQCGFFVTASSIYKTAAWGNTQQDSFLNQIIIIKTALSAQELLQHILDIELTMGRVRQEKYGSRIIDIDILFYGNEIIDAQNLTVPHPHIASRRFVLVPLVELTPSKIHPRLKKTMKTLLTKCNDNLSVDKV